MMTVESRAVCVATRHSLHLAIRTTPKPPTPIFHRPCPCAPLQMCIYTQTHMERRWGREGSAFVIEFVCAALLFTPPQPGGSAPMAEGGDCAFIGMEAEMVVCV